MVPNKQHYDCFSSLIEHSSWATHVYIFLCFQLFYQIIGEIAVMTNTREHNNKCVSSSVQTETRPSNADRKQTSGIEF